MRSLRFILLIVSFVFIANGCATVKGKGYADIGSGYFSSGDNKKAVEYLNKAVEKDPKNAGHLTMLGWSYFKLEELDSAIYTFEKLEQLDPEAVDAYTGRGWSYFKKLDFDKAIFYFEQALGIDTESADAFDGIGWCSMRKDDLEASQMYFNIALMKGMKYKKGTKTKTDAEAHRGLGHLNFNKGDYKNALTHFKTATINMPDWNDARVKWGDCLYALGQFGKAAGIYKHALKFDKSASAYDRVGWTYLKIKKYKAAKKYFNLALKIDPFSQSSLAGIEEVKKNLPTKQ